MSIFPPLTPNYILAFQFSSWSQRFPSSTTIRSVIIRPLPHDFKDYLDADGVFVPTGSDSDPINKVTQDNDDSDDDDDDDSSTKYSFPDLDQQIRDTIVKYGAVFPKLNFSSPRDAAWILPRSSPLKCTSPSDVYLLLKSSDYICHDIDALHVFGDCDPPLEHEYQLELVLRKWYAVDPSRELRCFVRHNTLIGISQRDMNYYDFHSDPATATTIQETVKTFWDSIIRPKCLDLADYTFDLLLTRDLQDAHIIDLNPYSPQTDPLLFSFEELADLAGPITAPSPNGANPPKLPVLRVITSRADPAANRNTPLHQHNMVPFDALSMSNGLDIATFAERWKQEISGATENDPGKGSH